MYCLLLKRMHLTFTAWVGFRNTRDDGGGQTYRAFQKHESVWLRNVSTGRHLLCVSLIASLKSNLCTALTTHNSTENNCIICHAQNTSAVQPIVFLSVIHRLLVTIKGVGGVGCLQRRLRSLQFTLAVKVSCKLLSQCQYIHACICVYVFWEFPHMLLRLAGRLWPWFRTMVLLNGRDCSGQSMQANKHATDEKSFQNFIRNICRRKTLWVPWCRWKYNIKMNCK